MTEIRLRDYSAGMNSEFSALLEKVRQLAEVTHTLRRENVELRTALTKLSAEHEQLSARTRQAHDRIAMLLETMAAAGNNQEAA